MPTVVIPFTNPILPRNVGEGVMVPRDTNADSPDGFFQVEATYTNEESGGNPIDFSTVVDSHSSGYPSEAPDGTNVATIDNLGFRGSMLALDPDPPPIRLAVKQTAPAELPNYGTVEPTSISGLFRVVRRANYPGTELVAFESAGFTFPPALGNVSIFKTYSQSASDEFQNIAVVGWIAGSTGWEFLWDHLQQGIAEVATARAGTGATAGTHEIRYIALELTYELASFPYRRTYPRDDGLAGGAGRTWPPPKSQQGSRRTFGDYL